MNEIVICKLCGNDFDALTQEIASYICPKCSKRKDKVKVLDAVSSKELTGFPVLRKTQGPISSQTIKSKNGASNGKEKAK